MFQAQLLSTKAWFPSLAPMLPFLLTAHLGGGGHSPGKTPARHQEECGVEVGQRAPGQVPNLPNRLWQEESSLLYKMGGWRVRKRQWEGQPQTVAKSVLLL